MIRLPLSNDPPRWCNVSRPPCGFSLIEVMVALVVIAVGLLGIAGMQALALSNTHIARTRSMATIEASSIASAMHANPAYWRTGAAPAHLTVIGKASGTWSATALNDGPLNGQTSDCSSGPCTGIEMAAYDLKIWGRQLARQIPGGKGAIACLLGANNIVNCTVTVNWNEKNMALNQATRVGTSQHAITLVVQP